MEPDLAGKITGMLLEMSEGDVIAIIEDKMACQDKVYLFHSFFADTCQRETHVNAGFQQLQTAICLF